MAHAVQTNKACLIATVLALLAPWPVTRAAEPDLEPVELELVLALDTSSSVDPAEYALQRHGLANAFRHPEVVAAIESCGGGAIAVTVVQWSGARMHLISVDWTLVRDRESAAVLADSIEAAPRLLTGFTGLTGAIRYSLKLIEGNRLEGRRKTIDISGDGSSSGLRPDLERDRAVRRGATINGLAILNEEPDLEAYYQRHVIGGRGAFAMSTADFASFAEAIRAKLAREIRCPKIARSSPVITSGATLQSPDRSDTPLTSGA